jgi:hypothetical protein
MKRIILYAVGLCVLLSACRKSDIPDPRPVVIVGNISARITDLPDDVTFDRISVEVVGFDWQTVATLQAPFQNDTARLILPPAFAAADLQVVDRGANGRNMEGYWPSTSSDPAARVVTLREEILVWNGERRLGRIFLTDWPGVGSSSIGKMYLNWQYADRPFVLNGVTGRTGFSFVDCSFGAGWNVLAKVNQSDEHIRVTTRIPQDAALAWRFEAWP